MIEVEIATSDRNDPFEATEQAFARQNQQKTVDDLYSRGLAVGLLKFDERIEPWSESDEAHA